MRTKTLHLLAGMLLLLLTACAGGSKMDDLLDRIPENYDVAAVGDVKTIVESAGVTIDNDQFKLPAYIKNKLPGKNLEQLDERNAFLRKSGVDLEACAVAAKYSKAYPIFVFILNDAKQFAKAIEDDGFREKDGDNGIAFYTKKTSESDYGPEYERFDHIAVKDGYAYLITDVWASSDFKPARVLRSFIEDAEDTSFADTKYGQHITAGNAAGIALKIPHELRQEMKEMGLPADIADLYEGVVCINASLTDNTARFSVRWFDGEGNEKRAEDFGKFMNLNAKINPKALAYLNKDESLVYAASVKDFDWDKYMEMMAEAAHMSRSGKAQLNIIKSYLQRIDGTIAIGFGVTNGMESLFKMSHSRDVMGEFSATAVCETKAGKAKGVVNDLKGLLDTQQVPYEDMAKGFTLPIPGENAALHVAYDGDMLIFSNRPVKAGNDNATVKGVKFEDHIMAMALVLEKNHPLMRDLKVDSDVKMVVSTKADPIEVTFELTVDGDNSVGVIGKLAKIVIGIADRGEELDRKWRNAVYGPDYSDSSYENYASDDYAVEDSAVVEDILE